MDFPRHRRRPWMREISKVLRMSRSCAGSGENPLEVKLPRRDWFLLPMLSLITICLVIVSVMTIANRRFHVPISTLAGCFIMNDRSTGIRAIPNTTCSEQLPESELVEYTFNSCGHRAGVECGQKPPGNYRIVALGSSFSYGAHVEREQSFAALLPAELSRQTGRQIEIYNESMFGGWPRSVALHLHEAFGAEPDMILWTFTPSDIQFASLVLWSDVDPVTLPDSVIKAGFLARTWYRVKVSFTANSVQGAIAYLWNYESKVFRSSLTGVFLQNVLYASQRRYVSSYLNGPDSEVGFLRAKPSAEWRSNLEEFERNAAEIEARAKAEGVPLVAALLPNRAQTAMISMGVWPEGFDPYHLADDLRSIITRHGATYVDILPDFRSIPNPERGYLPVDGHPDAQGHAMLSAVLAKELTSGAVPALRAANK
jgi:hypothetical protein